MRRAWFVVAVLVLTASSIPLMAGTVSAHSPTFPGNNTSLANATLIENPSKSWAIYTHLEEGTVQYYGVDLRAGDRLYLNLIVPTHEKGTGFRPDTAILGPFVERNGTLPPTVTYPNGSGWKTINGSIPDRPTYEAFSPGTFLNLATYDERVPADGRYYVVVYQDPGRAPIHGDYGLAVGYVESFTITEFVLIPISLVSVYQWEGQSLFQVFAPMAAVFIAGMIVLDHWRRDALRQMGWAHRFTMIAGLLFISTAGNTIVQTILAISQTGVVAEVLLTMVFIVAPLLLGWFALRISLSGGHVLTRRRRFYIFIAGFVGLFVWGGLIIGPVFAMVGSVLPGKAKTESGQIGQHDGETGTFNH